jgi:hypothetical protein
VVTFSFWQAKRPHPARYQKQLNLIVMNRKIKSSKRVNKSKNNSVVSARSFSRYKMPFPDIFRTNMGCAFMGTMPAATATSGYFYVSGNSLSYPFNSTMVYATRSINYYSATGYSGESYSTVQPEGFTALCGTTKMYQNYRVTGSKITVQLAPTSTADNILLVVGATSIGTTSTTTIWTASEAPLSSKAQTFTSFECDKRIVRRLSTQRVFGVPAATVQTDPYAGSYNTSPTAEWAWVIQWQVVDNTTTNAIMGVNVQVEYQVEFFKPTTGGLPDTYAKKVEVIEDNDPPGSSSDDTNSNTASSSTGDDEICVNGSVYKKVR